MSRKALRKKKSDAKRQSMVSDHALVRYIERVEGVDLTWIRRKIIDTPGLHAFIENFPRGTFPSGCKPGHRFIVKDGLIVTVVVDGSD